MDGLITEGVFESITWVAISLLGSLMLVFSFISGTLAQAGLLTVSAEDRIILNRKTRWIRIFPLLLTAFYIATISLAFPPFFKAGVTGPYWLWVIMGASWVFFLLIAESGRFNKKSGCGGYCLLLNISGAVPIFILGVIVSIMFTGADFTFNRQDLALALNPEEFRWTGPTNGLERIDDWRSILLGLFLVMMSRVTGILFLMKYKPVAMNDRYLRKQLSYNSALLLVMLILFFVILFLRPGFQIHEISGMVEYRSRRYFKTLLAMPWMLMLFSSGVVSLVTGILMALISPEKSMAKGFNYSASGVFILMLTLFFLAGFGLTPFYPSRPDMQSSLSFSNAAAGQEIQILVILGVIVSIVTVLLLFRMFIRKALRS